MDWGTLVATVSGGFIAMSGTVLSDRLRNRHEDDRNVTARRRAVHTEFIGPAGLCHARLRQLAQAPDTAADLDAASRAALTDAALCEVWERLFIDVTAEVAGAGQLLGRQRSLPAVPGRAKRGPLRAWVTGRPRHQGLGTGLVRLHDVVRCRLSVTLRYFCQPIVRKFQSPSPAAPKLARPERTA